MADLVWRGSRAELLERLAALPAALAGRVPELADASRAVAQALGIEGMACVRDDFIDKARGGGGSDGVPWPPLSPKTIAYNRRHPGLSAKRTRAARAGRSSRPLLTAAQDRLWRGVYSGRLRAGDDPATAAARAWAVTKRAGGKTIIGTYGNAQVEIGRDTGRLLNSLSPASPEADIDAVPGSVSVGSNVEYAKHFFAKRPIVPAALPPRWRVRLLDVLDAAMPEFMRALLAD